MTEHWVFNASPLILLGKAGQLEWLTRLGNVIIPSAVVAEIQAGSFDDPARQFVEDSNHAALIRKVTAKKDVLAWNLGSGETAVISWAIDHLDHEAVIDDAAARRCGDVFGIRLRGTLSLVALAKKRGLRLQTGLCTIARRRAIRIADLGGTSRRIRWGVMYR